MIQLTSCQVKIHQYVKTQHFAAKNTGKAKKILVLSPRLEICLQCHRDSWSWVDQMLHDISANWVQIQFRSVASFRSEGNAKATAVKNQDQISDCSAL